MLACYSRKLHFRDRTLVSLLLAPFALFRARARPWPNRPFILQFPIFRFLIIFLPPSARFFCANFLPLLAGRSLNSFHTEFTRKTAKLTKPNEMLISVGKREPFSYSPLPPAPLCNTFSLLGARARSSAAAVRLFTRPRTNSERNLSESCCFRMQFTVTK